MRLRRRTATRQRPHPSYSVVSMSSMMPAPGSVLVSVMFENRSFDNLLGRPYQPGEVASFEGVTGRELTTTGR